MHAQQLNIITWIGVYPERRNVSFQVLLEKFAGVCLVEKPRYIQLCEVDFKFFQKFTFGKEAIKSLTDKGFLTEERFSKKGHIAEDTNFDKTLTEDLSRQV